MILTVATKRASGLGFSALLLPFFATGVEGQITLEEIAQHSSNDDCWSAVYGEVYDVTGYAPSHPNPSVYAMCGQEATAMFDGVHGDTPNYMDIFPGIEYLGTVVEPTDPPTSPAPTVEPTASPQTLEPTAAPTEPAVTPAPTKAPTEQTPAPTDAAPGTPSPTNGPTTIQVTPQPTPSLPPTPSTNAPGTPSPTTPAPAKVQVPLVELASHNTQTDCWIAIHDMVYEFTSFLRLHPGGRTILAPCCGFDCTASFDDKHNLSILEEYAKYYAVAPLEKTLSEEELRSYNTIDNCLVSYFGRIFNATAYYNGMNSVADYSTALSKQGLTGAVDLNTLPCGGVVTLLQFSAMSPGISDFYIGALEGAFGSPQSSPQPNGPDSTTSFSVTLPPGAGPGLVGTDGGGGNTGDSGRGNGLITPNELAQHASEGDCWSVYFGKVYRMEDYTHPGGQALITASCGGDATSGFTGAGHPDSYMNMVSQYFLGDYAGGGNGGGNNPQPVPVPQPAPQPAPQPDNNSGGNGNGPITAAELAQHASEGNCWSVYFGKVYRMEDYTHPGGQGLITASCGRDATSGFTGAGHPDSYMNMVSQYFLGDYAGGGNNPQPVPQPAPQPAPQPDNNSGGNGNGPISASELAQHASEGDCWSVYFGKVYRMEDYTHPGGQGLITASCGRDATSGFTGAGHPDSYMNMVSQYFVGDYSGGGNGGGNNPQPVPQPAPQPAPQPDNTSGGNGNGPITPAELAQHVSEGDCWSVYFGKVYRMDDYTHPGGQGLISASCGRDATSGFTGAGHPDSYMNMVSQYLIGDYAGDGGGNGGGNGSGNGGVITAADLAFHSSTDDCWVSYYGEVYDVTNYAPNHPAGSGLVTMDCGRDGTSNFEGAHSRGTLGIISGSFMGMMEGFDPAPGGGPLSGDFPMDSESESESEDESEEEEEEEEEPQKNNSGGNGNGPITPVELAQHSSSGDCWQVYGSNVYDMTNYNHPGGQGFITSSCGGDATGGFQGVHPDSYLDMVSQFLVGPFVASGGGGNPVPAPQPVPAPPPPTNNGGGPITPAELAQHSSSGDCWQVYGTDVYDMTNYNHPGGQGFITGSCGGDATGGFRGVHPDSYLNMVSQFRIGPYAGGPAPAPAPAPANNGGGGGGGVITMAELGMHSSSNDCWVSYFGLVYDVTSYAPRHPAGSGLVTGDCGRDGTAGFSSAHGRGTLGAISGSFIGNLEGGGGGGPPMGGGGGYGDSPESMDDESNDGGGGGGDESNDGGGGGGGNDCDDEEDCGSEDDRRQ